MATSPPRRPRSGTKRPVTLFYSPAYWAEAPDFDTFRKPVLDRAATHGGSRHDPRLRAVRTARGGPARRPARCGAHGGHISSAVDTGTPEALAASNGLPWTPGLYAAAECSSQGIAQAAVRALQTGGPTGSLSAGLHHARADRGAGFCTFNGLALAAQAAIVAGAKSILILDLDAHFGGGTWSIVSGWTQVWHADVSVSAFDGYDPTGHPRSIVELVTSGADYLDTIRRVLDRLSTTTFDLVIYNAGMDPFERCDVGGLRGITMATLDLREQLVFDWARARAIPVAFALAGGYTGPTLSRDDLVNLHLLTIDAANPRRRALGPPDRLRTGCPLGDTWRAWDFLNVPHRELPHTSQGFNADVELGDETEPLTVTWERGPDDALYRPPTAAEGGGVDWRFEHGSPAHQHAEFEVDGRRVHLDCVSGTKSRSRTLLDRDRRVRGWRVRRSRVERRVFARVRRDEQYAVGGSHPCWSCASGPREPSGHVMPPVNVTHHGHDTSSPPHRNLRRSVPNGPHCSPGRPHNG